MFDKKIFLSIPILVRDHLMSSDGFDDLKTLSNLKKLVLWRTSFCLQTSRGQVFAKNDKFIYMGKKSKVS